MKEQKSIFNMEIGETGIITDLNEIDRRVFNRFLDIGIAPHAKVKLLNRISCNRLFIIEIDDVEICIRRNDAKKIKISN